MILGIGLDVCDVGRIRRALEARTGTRFQARVFTAGERAYCEARRRGRFASYAARFAAKEAALKALGTGLRGGIAWKQVEVRREAGGRPTIAFTGAAAGYAAKLGARHIALSLSHTQQHAIAQVILED